MKFIATLIKIVKAIVLPLTVKTAIYTSVFFVPKLIAPVFGPIPTVVATVLYITIGPEIVTFMML